MEFVFWACMPEWERGFDMSKKSILHKIKMTVCVAAVTVACVFATVDAKAATCATPTGIVQTVGTENAIQVKWKASNGATNYGVSISKDGGKTWSAEQVVNQPEHIINGLERALNYKVRVRAYNASGWSEYSKPYSVVTAPKKPGKIKLVATSSTAVKVSWDAVSNASGYNIYWAKGTAETQYVGKTDKTSLIIKDIKPNTQYTVEVQPFLKSSNNFYACGPASKNSKVYTLCGPIKSPSVSTWNTTTGDITIKWKSGSVYADGYEVVFTNYKGKKIASFDVAGKSSRNGTAKVRKLLNRATYVQVRAYKTIDKVKNYGEFSKPVAIVPEACVSAVQTSPNSVQLKWKKIENATGYAVYYSTNPNTGFKLLKKLSKSTTSYTIANIPLKTTYYVYVAPTRVTINKKKVGVSKNRIHNVVIAKNTTVVPSVAPTKAPTTAPSVAPSATPATTP